MRIIAGKYRGRKIEQPDLESVRPTKDRIREALFNMISGKIPGAKVLDLFAGSGAFGLEALSRGAQNAIFVDREPACTDVIKRNTDTLKIEDIYRIIREDAACYIKKSVTDKTKFDIIFSDPPYSTGLAKKTLILINQYDILNPSGLLVLEHHVDEDIRGLAENITILKQKTYKNISLSIFRKK